MQAILDQLNPSQREAVISTENPLIIFAGAGTGKTRVITYRIAYLLQKGVSPWQILAVTFTNKAADVMRMRVNALAPGVGKSVWVSTFHSFGARFLREEAASLKLMPGFLIYDSTDQKKIIAECITELNLDEKKFKLSRVADAISRAKDDLLDAASYAIHALTADDPQRQAIAAIYSLYQQKLDQAGALDFGDLLMLPVAALRDNAALREKYQERFRYLLVDEYQDTNHAQYMLAKYLSGKHKNICVVGDDDQSIYSWRGADIRNILEFERDYPGCKMVKLEQNYRSTPEVLAAAHQVVKNNLQRVNKTIWTENVAGEAPVFMENNNEQEEANSIVREIERLRREKNLRLSDFAVFYRTNAQSRVLEDALRRNGTPYTIVGTVRFYERAEVKDILAYLRLVHNPNDNISFKRVVNTPRRGVGKSSLEIIENFALLKGVSLFAALEAMNELSLSNSARKGLLEFKKFIEDMRLRRETLSIKEMAARVISGTGYVAELEEEDTAESKSRIENINELMSAIDEFESRSPDKSVGGYLTQVVLVSDLDSWNNENDSVTLMTLHLAKGLEFETVFITGLEEGLFPIGEAAFAPGELEEERRLMYVGMTRAKKTLYLSWAAERRVNGKSRWNVPSRFVEEAGWDGGNDRCGGRLQANNLSGGDEPRSFLRNAYAGRNKLHVRIPEPMMETDEGAFPLGCRVNHPKFGPGKVFEKSGSGDDLKLVIVFDEGGWKKVIAKYANLQII